MRKKDDTRRNVHVNTRDRACRQEKKNDYFIKFNSIALKCTGDFAAAAAEQSVFSFI